MSIDKVPNSMMAVMAVMALLAPLIFMAARGNPGMLAVWMAVYLSIGVIATLGAMIFERSKKSKSKDFSKNVERNAGSTEGVKDPGQLAQIDHMRKEFQRGIDIYKRYGKDLYSLPWYIVVGEAGSGKTEALRRSEIGFPDKLQDKWQGSGGTLSMHWWFTNKAVILDTAGRLFVQDGGDAESTRAQWTSFLQMLRKNRPDCPINGMILVIPATRLLANEDPDSESASLARLDQNAGQIARQLETLQQELGIRFPVYILISKTDKITGFREFFSSIERADERYQMLGWSNPAPLGENFNPQSVADYIQSVSDRLKRRMMTTLRSPVPEQPDRVRIDEVDSVFAFPNAFAAMAPKLTRYLRHVFASDEWSARPPFLRGIYFTSALQQGRVLDEALAKAMGIPIEEMEADAGDDGLGLSKHRTYFIRDLFLEKIFREKGLVTRADKAKPAVTGWKLWVPACFLVGLGVFVFLGWLTSRPGTESDRWRRLFAEKSDEQGRLMRPVATINPEQGPGRWNADVKVPQILTELAGDLDGRPKFGWVFTPAQWFDRSLAGERREVFGRISADVVTDLIQQSHSTLERRIDMPPSAEQANALRALLWFKHGEPGGGKITLPGQEPDEGRDVDKLIQDLVSFVGLNETSNDEIRVREIADLVNQSIALRDSGFKAALQSGMDEIDLKKMVDDSLNPAAGYDSGFAERLNALAELHDRVLKSLERTGRADEQDMGKLRSDATRLIENHAEDLRLAQERKPTDKQDAGADIGAAAITSLRGDVLRLQRQGIGNYNEMSVGNVVVFTEPARKLLEDRAALLADIPNALAPDMLDGSPGFTKSETEKLLGLLDNENTLNPQFRRWWLENEFFPNEFKKYLRFPFVMDGEIGNRDELLRLAKLIKIGEVLRRDSGKWPFNERLVDVAGILMDEEFTYRKVKITPNVLDDGQSLIVRINHREGLSTYSTRGIQGEPAELCISTNISISVTLTGGNAESVNENLGIRNQDWDLIRWYTKPGRSSNPPNKMEIRQRDNVGIDVTFDVFGGKLNPQDWPSMATSSNINN